VHGLPAESAYTESFLLLAGAGLAAFAVALLVPSARRPAPAAEERPIEAIPELTPVEV
jgi:hypothetical protein